MEEEEEEEAAWEQPEGCWEKKKQQQKSIRPIADELREKVPLRNKLHDPQSSLLTNIIPAKRTEPLPALVLQWLTDFL